MAVVCTDRVPAAPFVPSAAEQMPRSTTKPFQWQSAFVIDLFRFNKQPPTQRSMPVQYYSSGTAGAGGVRAVHHPTRR